MLSHDQLLIQLYYNPDTGLFHWIKSKQGGKPIGTMAGYIESDGYRRIGINRKVYSAHRLAWFYQTGSWPTKHVDHLNGNKDDNRWINLRDVSPSVNKTNTKHQKNNKLQEKYINWHKGNKAYRVQIRKDGVIAVHKMFKNIDDAINYRNQSIVDLFGHEHPQLNTISRV